MYVCLQHVPTQQKGKVCSYVCIYMSICTAFRQKFCRMYDQENESSDSKTHQLRWQSTDGDESVSYVTFSSRCTPLPEVPTAPTGALTCPCSLSPSCHAGDLSAAPSWTPPCSPPGAAEGASRSCLPSGSLGTVCRILKKASISTNDCLTSL